MADPVRVTTLSDLRVRLGELSESPVELRLDLCAPERADLARRLDLVELPRLEADLEVRRWMDGAEVAGSWRAAVVQTCGVTLEPFETPLEGALRVRALPPGSPYAPPEADALEIDPDAEDPPDRLEDDAVDAGELLVEHLALEIDPYPRKPGAEFVPPEEPAPSSPFDVLKRLNS